MAFTKTNTGTTTWGDLLPLTNKTTNAANVEVLRGLDKPGCSGANIDIDLTYLVGGAGAQITWTQNSVIADLRYYKIYVNDGVGNEATSLIDVAATTTPVVMDTSGLDASQTWCVTIYISDNSSGADCKCENKYQAAIGSIASDPTDTLTTADVVGALAVEVNGVATADAGTFAFGASSVDDVLVATLKIENATADSLVTVTAITGSGDGSITQQSFLPFTLDDASFNSQVQITMDTATVGAKTYSVVITSDDAASPYNIDITTTVS